MSESPPYESVPEGTLLLTEWGPALAGRYWPEDRVQEVIFQEGATHNGVSLAGMTGAHGRWTVVAWELEARRKAVSDA